LKPEALIRTAWMAGMQQLLEFGLFPRPTPTRQPLRPAWQNTGPMGHVAYVDFGMMEISNQRCRIASP